MTIDINRLKQLGLADSAGNITVDNKQINNLLAASQGHQAVNLEQMQAAIAASKTSSERQDSVKSIVTDIANVAVPSAGDRYLILGGATAEEGQIATRNDANDGWDYTVPTQGMDVTVDDENNGIYLYGVTTWSKLVIEVTTAKAGELVKVGQEFGLAASGVTAGAKGAALKTVTVTVDAFGRVTNLVEQDIPTASESQLGVIQLASAAEIKAKNATKPMTMAAYLAHATADLTPTSTFGTANVQAFNGDVTIDLDTCSKEDFLFVIASDMTLTTSNGDMIKNTNLGTANSVPLGAGLKVEFKKYTVGVTNYAKVIIH